MKGDCFLVVAAAAQSANGILLRGHTSVSSAEDGEKQRKALLTEDAFCTFHGYQVDDEGVFTGALSHTFKSEFYMHITF